MRRALLLVDCQYDYIIGNMSVPNSVWYMDKLANEIFETHGDYYECIMFGVDQHPINHVSFKKEPEHCLQHSFGAAIYKGIYDAALFYSKPIYYYLRGESTNIVHHSLLSDIDSRLAIFRAMREHKLEQIDLAGPSKSVLELIEDFYSFQKEKYLNVLLDFCPSDEYNKTLKTFMDEKKIAYYENSN